MTAPLKRTTSAFALGEGTHDSSSMGAGATSTSDREEALLETTLLTSVLFWSHLAGMRITLPPAIYQVTYDCSKYASVYRYDEEGRALPAETRLAIIKEVVIAIFRELAHSRDYSLATVITESSVKVWFSKGKDMVLIEATEPIEVILSETRAAESP